MYVCVYLVIAVILGRYKSKNELFSVTKLIDFRIFTSLTSKFYNYLD